MIPEKEKGNAILHSLTEGSKSFAYLVEKTGMTKDAMERAISCAEQRHEIIRVPVNGQMWFSLPKALPKDEPLLEVMAYKPRRKTPPPDPKAPQKVCLDCKQAKDIDQFPPNNGGRGSYCRHCKYHRTARYQQRMDRITSRG